MGPREIEGAEGGKSLPPLPRLRMLTDEQLEEVHRSSLEILQRTGIRVEDSTGVELLREAGSSVDNGSLVKIPASLIERALETAPSRIDLYSRTGDLRLELGSSHTHFGTGAGLSHTTDLITSERRPSVLADVVAYTRLADSLANLDFVMGMARPVDVPAATADHHTVVAMMRNTVKPIVFSCRDHEGLSDLLQMAERVAGGSQGLADKPFLLVQVSPTSPLVLSESVVQQIFLLADRGLPCVCSPTIVGGGSASMTSVDSLAVTMASGLTLLAIAQLRNSGTPVVLGSSLETADPRQPLSTRSSPELMRHSLALVEMIVRRYALPVWGISGSSDSKLPDIQAGIDSALWTLWMALSGADLIHDVGFVESARSGSFQMMVVADEVVGHVRHLLRPDGDVWQPRLFDRRDYEGWVAAGRPNMIRTARELAIEWIGSHEPEPLSPGLERDLRRFLEEADQRSNREAQM